MSTRTKLVTLKWVRKQIYFNCDKPYPKPEKLSAEKDCESSQKKGEEESMDSMFNILNISLHSLDFQVLTHRGLKKLNCLDTWSS